MALQAGLSKGGAAKGELILAIFELANCFRNGWGVDRDPVAAKQVRLFLFFCSFFPTSGAPVMLRLSLWFQQGRGVYLFVKWKVQETSPALYIVGGERKVGCPDSSH